MAKAQLGALFGEIHGAAGTAVLVRTKEGLILKPRVRPRYPGTPKQMAYGACFSYATKMWRTLSPEQMAAWKAYAATLAVPRPGDTPLPPQTLRVFIGLTVKLLQMGVAREDLPLLPPTGAFPGDWVRLSPSAPGGLFLQFEADVPNHEGVTTELLIQKLPAAHYRTYPQRYRSAGFFQFASGSMETTIGVPWGRCYACAFRFVETASGRMTGLVECGVVTIPH